MSSLPLHPLASRSLRAEKREVPPAPRARLVSSVPPKGPGVGLGGGAALLLSGTWPCQYLSPPPRPSRGDVLSFLSLIPAGRGTAREEGLSFGRALSPSPAAPGPSLLPLLCFSCRGLSKTARPRHGESMAPLLPCEAVPVSSREQEEGLEPHRDTAAWWPGPGELGGGGDGGGSGSALQGGAHKGRCTRSGGMGFC